MYLLPTMRWYGAAIHQGDNIGSGRAMMVALHRRNATSRFSCLFIFRFAANMGSFFVTMDLGRLRGFIDGGAVGRCFFPDFGANLMRSVIPADTGLVQMCISSFGIGIRIRRLPSSIASHRGESSGKKLNLFCAFFFCLSSEVLVANRQQPPLPGNVPHVVELEDKNAWLWLLYERATATRNP